MLCVWNECVKLFVRSDVKRNLPEVMRNLKTIAWGNKINLERKLSMNNFEQMPQHSRIWIYQAARELSEIEIAETRSKSAAFLAEWTSHGSKMKAAVEVLHKRFIIVAVDEQAAAASGCGIDKSVRFMQELEKQLDVALFDRMQVAYKQSNGEIAAVKMTEFEQLAAEGRVNANTLVFNNMIQTLDELQTGWLVPAHTSWHARLIPAL